MGEDSLSEQVVDGIADARNKGCLVCGKNTFSNGERFHLVDEGILCDEHGPKGIAMGELLSDVSVCPTCGGPVTIEGEEGEGQTHWYRHAQADEIKQLQEKWWAEHNEVEQLRAEIERQAQLAGGIIRDERQRAEQLQAENERVKTSPLTPYGEVVKRAERLEAALRRLEWAGHSIAGGLYCVACQSYETNGHQPDCFLVAALHPPDTQQKEGGDGG